MLKVDTKPLYHSPWGLLPFQAEGVAKGLLNLTNLYVWSAGLGKSHVAMATAASLFEYDKIDLCIVICEGDKTLPDEWPGDFAKFTDLSTVVYKGAIKKREKIRKEISQDKWQVLISTYETMRNDIAKWISVESKGRSIRRLVPNYLTESLAGMRVLVVYDEMPAKLGNRSDIHKAHDLFVKTLRENGECRVMTLTATPIERGPENFYNIGRILVPERMGTVKSFEENHVEAWDIFGNPIRFKNLDVLAGKMTSILHRKRKEDDDVRAQFPEKVEEHPMYVSLSPLARDFYETVVDVFEGTSEWEQQQLWTVTRLIAGHPLSLMTSESKIAQAIVSEVGEAGLKALGAPKIDRMLSYLQPILVGQGAQVVIFTFFGQSILPLVRGALEAAGHVVAVNRGGMSPKAKAASKEAFKAGDANVFLTSDAGCRGINLPQGQYVLHFELPLTHANWIQRSDRIHRIDSQHELVTISSLIVRDTVEDGIAELVLRRNAWSDVLLGDEDAGGSFISAEDRRRIIRTGRK